MEVKQGYKQTEVGVIPDKWIVDKLGNCLKNKPDYGIGAAAVKYNDNLFTYLRITDISDDGKFLKTNLASVDNPNSENYILNENEIVVARTGASVGKTYLYKKDDGKLIFAGFLIRLRPEPSKISSQFLFAITKSKHYKDWILSNSMRSGQPGINSNQLNGFLIPLPPIHEQTAIANALSDMDALISQTEKLIEKKKAIKQGAMQELLKPKDGWVTKKLGDVCEIKKGQLITDSTRINGSIPVIAGGKSPAYYHNKANRLGKTITISGSGASAGYVAFHTQPIFASDCSTISEAKNYKLEFIFYWLQLNQFRIYKMQTGGAQPHIHPSDLNPLEFNLPPIEQQNEISDALYCADLEISFLELKLNKLKQQKQGMMQALLTGKIRLVS
jgi:type I restriction enzyme S subunit